LTVLIFSFPSINLKPSYSLPIVDSLFTCFFKGTNSVCKVDRFMKTVMKVMLLQRETRTFQMEKERTLTGKDDLRGNV
jgi:hypothetical protein